MSFIPLDPWRAIGGQTNYVKLNGVEFCGKVVAVTRDGICIEGDWGLLGTMYYPRHGWGDYAPQKGYNDFFVANFPYHVFPGEIIPSEKHLMAWFAGDCTNQIMGAGSQPIRKLDYGTPCGPNPDQLGALQKQRQAAAEKRRERDSRRIEELLRYATNGDSSAQYSLAFHYLHGIGCETNQAMGLFWLIKSSAQGNIAASNDLQAIESPSTTPASNRP